MQVSKYCMYGRYLYGGTVPVVPGPAWCLLCEIYIYIMSANDTPLRDAEPGSEEMRVARGLRGLAQANPTLHALPQV